MDNATSEQLIDQVNTAQQRLTALLRSVADNPDWRPDPEQWSFREIAAHLATVDQECYRDRVTRIAAGESPHFENYFNTGRDFGPTDLQAWLGEWAATRQEIVDRVRAVPQDRLSLTGTHAAFGTITVHDVLRQMLDHDREHVQDLERMIGEYKSKTG